MSSPLSARSMPRVDVRPNADRQSASTATARHAGAARKNRRYKRIRKEEREGNKGKGVWKAQVYSRAVFSALTLITAAKCSCSLSSRSLASAGASNYTVHVRSQIRT